MTCALMMLAIRTAAAKAKATLQRFVRDVQIALRLLDARMAEHQLNDADVDAACQQATRALVSKVAPAEIDTLQLGSRPGHALVLDQEHLVPPARPALLT